MIQTEEVSKVFRKTEKVNNKEIVTEFPAVDCVSLKAVPGEVLGILGPNGAGKTTLLRMMGCLMQPSSGQVLIYDRNGNQVTDEVERKKQIGYLSGNTKLYHRFSIRETLEMLGKVYGLNKQQIESRIEEIIELLSLQKFVDNRIEKLSTGQTQRANIARCLIHSPQIYIFDEPTLGLDILSSEAIIEFMKKERENGKTILYSTHYMEEAQYLCDRIVMMNQGRIIAMDRAETLMHETGTNNLRDTFYYFLRGEDRKAEKIDTQKMEIEETQNPEKIETQKTDIEETQNIEKIKKQMTAVGESKKPEVEGNE